MSSKRVRKVLLSIFIALISFYFYFYLIINRNNLSSFKKNKFRGVLELKNILEDEEFLEHPKSRKIFFIETHLEGERNVNSRQACSVESAALLNVDMEIFLIFATDQLGVDLIYSEVVAALMSYPNIHLRFLNLFEFAKETPIEDFMEQGLLFESIHPIEHTSDILRMLILYKYGGLYLDLDVISLVPFNLIDFDVLNGTKNFACDEDDIDVATGILNIDGRFNKIMQLYLEGINEEFNATTWSGNGNEMFTISLLSFCDAIDEIPEDVYYKCDDFMIMPSEKCYPIYYEQWNEIFEEEFKDYIFDILNSSGAYFLHVWNKMIDFDNKSYKLTYDSKSAYVELAKRNCPKVYETLFRFF